MVTDFLPIPATLKRPTMRTLLLFSLALLLLTGCSARTRYTVVVDAANYISNKSGSIPTAATESTVLVPDNKKEGQPISLPKQDVVEEAKLNVKAALSNTGSSDMTGSLEVRLSDYNDTDLTDGNSDFSLSKVTIAIPPGNSQTVLLDAVINSTQNANALKLIQGGSFRMVFILKVTSPGGTYTLTQARISVTGRPFALIQ